MTHHNLPPDVVRIYDEWAERNPEDSGGSGCRDLLTALTLVAVIAALTTFAMWMWSR